MILPNVFLTQSMWKMKNLSPLHQLMEYHLVYSLAEISSKCTKVWYHFACLFHEGIPCHNPCAVCLFEVTQSIQSFWQQKIYVDLNLGFWGVFLNKCSIYFRKEHVSGMSQNRKWRLCHNFVSKITKWANGRIDFDFHFFYFHVLINVLGPMTISGFYSTILVCSLTRNIYLFFK